ncbi:MAG: hypothetical protein HY043_16730 [Verrucomicrobia bacterium]|nr:hypothetical protein [Verrucomicrobiota bacterium]
MKRIWLMAILSFCWSGFNSDAAVVKVACIGDSITEGSGLANAATESYPAKLQRLLGAGYAVRNFGVSGRTLLRKGDFPYWKEKAFTESQKYEPDLVTIMLGTNDGKPYNWRYGTNFLTDYQDLIATYTNLASHPRILLCTPCPVFLNGAFDIKPGTVATNIAPAVRELSAAYGLQTLDLQIALAGHREWFPDTVHPDTKGTAVLAALFYVAIAGDHSGADAPSLSIERDLSNRAVLKWPTDWAGWVLQSTTAWRDSNTIWTVVQQPAWNDNATVRVTNTISGTLKFHRLWNPSN